MNPIRELEKLGQSVWLDFITRQFITEGKLAKLIQEDGLSGVTSNPTIFQKAITGGQETSLAVAFVVERRLAPLVVGGDPRDVAAVWSRHTRLNRYLRNREPLLAEDLNYVMDRGLWRK